MERTADQRACCSLYTLEHFLVKVTSRRHDVTPDDVISRHATDYRQS